MISDSHTFFDLSHEISNIGKTIYKKLQSFFNNRKNLSSVKRFDKKLTSTKGKMIDSLISLFVNIFYYYGWLCAIVAVLRWLVRTRFVLTDAQRKGSSKYRFVVVGAGMDLSLKS